MVKMTISMPAAMREYVASRVEGGQYGNVSEYFRDLIRREQERRNAAQELGGMLDSAEASGVSKRSVEEIWSDAEERHAARDA